MTTLDRYLLKRLTTAFLQTITALISIFIIIDLLTHRRNSIMDNDVPAQIVLQYYTALIPTMLNAYQLAPLALLIATLLIFGTLVQRSEYTATLAGGIGLIRIIRAPAILAISITLLMFITNETIAPAAAATTARIIEHHFHDHIEDDSIGIFWPQLQDGWKCDIRVFDRKTLKGSSVYLYSIQENQHQEIQAETIHWDTIEAQWILQNGHWTTYQDMTGETKPFTTIPAPFNETPEYLDTAEIDTQAQSILQLAALMKKHQNQPRIIRKMTLDLNTKIVEPLLCMLFTAIAIPFSLELRRGGLSISISIAIFVGLTYLIIAGIAHTLGNNGQIQPITAAWFPFILYFIVCSALISRTPT